MEEIEEKEEDTEYEEEEMEYREKKLRESSLIWGIKPITRKIIDAEEEKNNQRKSNSWSHNQKLVDYCSKKYSS